MQSDLLDRVMLVADTAGAAPKVRGTWLRLLTEVLELAGPCAELISHAERPWTSATFNGTRHSIALTFTGENAVSKGRVFAEALPDHAFNLPRHVVADATSAPVSLRQTPTQLAVDVEILVLDDL